ncbi:disintegrin and metalloproteinase domain-containing protein 23 isoform X1 [Clarias gariepinus]|uniref:disintegrin and metalloproteinase domain-containing protein 23 isoform X1 n=1 Tax=Clarias gariepinus TaxID=13013 RepID=UPI00234CE04E|nr:disintegrin and metalloproteinase domain-containing protein 23 isoform X1 [Clarias gariepinus]
MRLIFHPRLLASVLIALLPSFSSASVVSVENERGSAAPWQDATAAPETTSSGNATNRQDKEVAVTYPSRLVYYVNEEAESAYHDLDTRARNQAAEGQAIHLAQASFQLDAFGSTFTLDLALNNDLLSSNYVEIHYEKDKPVFSKGGEHCYYHGQVRGKDASHVALSTCNGLHGMFDDGAFVYLIAPLNQTHAPGTGPRPHTLYRTSSLRMGRNLADLATEDQGEDEEEEEQILSDMPWLRRRRRRAVPQKVFDEIKYLEIMIVSDHNTFKRHKSKKHTRNFAKSVVNLVDAIFKEQLNTRVVLVAVEIWTDRDRIPLSVKPLDMLKDFSKYRQQNIGVKADAVHLFTNVTFHYGRSSMAYIGGVCSVGRGVGVNEFGSTWTMAASLSQSLAQNLGIQWDPVSRRKECGCMDSWVGCIMEDTGVQHPRRFSKCSITDFKNFLLRGGGSCLFNRPNKLFEATECGNGYVEVGEECDCGTRMECYKDCCKKCSLSNGAHCSDGPCCNSTCLFLPRGYSCRYSVNDCDISESCSGDSGQCPPNLHKQDGYSCQLNQGRCYGGECKTRDSQCKYIWGTKAGVSEKHCYEKLNTEGTEKGNCGKDGEKWIPCSKHDVFCGYLLCTNIGRNPRIGTLKGDITPTTFNHQGRLIDCSGGRVLLDDDTDLGYVEDGTACGPSMMCLERKCVPISSLNLTACPSGPNGRVCSSHGVCNNEATCTCDEFWAGTDCSMHDPRKEPPAVEDEGPKETLKKDGTTPTPVASKRLETSALPGFPWDSESELPAGLYPLLLLTTSNLCLETRIK